MYGIAAHASNEHSPLTLHKTIYDELRAGNKRKNVTLILPASASTTQPSVRQSLEELCILRFGLVGVLARLLFGKKLGSDAEGYDQIYVWMHVLAVTKRVSKGSRFIAPSKYYGEHVAIDVVWGCCYGHFVILGGQN